jgi:hypothetical protein
VRCGGAPLPVLQKSQIEGCKHQHNPDIHYQPFPKSIFEEQEIYTNDNGNQRHNVKRRRHVPCHLKSPVRLYRQPPILQCSPLSFGQQVD